MPQTMPAFDLEPQYRDYVWGGTRLRPGQITAEAWIVHEDNRISSGPLQGKTLLQAASQAGPALLGQISYERIGTRFPLLIKLLDCADWLSVQVHPNDRQAVALEGEGKFGKTEAWHILTADPGAEILCGFKPGVEKNAILESVKDGTILNHAQRVSLLAGDTIFIPAGTVHALGPGLLVYEVQQTSDITYRVFDWNRPASAGRKLHIEQSLAVLDSQASGTPIHEPVITDGEQTNLVKCPYFSLDLLRLENETLQLDPAELTFHTLTPIMGRIRVSGDGWEMEKGALETVLVPASAGRYTISASEPARILKASIAVV
jgi:mannose-6-phosphate isomerase